MAKVIKELRDYGGSSCLLAHHGDHYVAITRRSPFWGVTTYVHEASDDGRICWDRPIAAGGEDMTRDQAIDELKAKRPGWVGRYLNPIIGEDHKCTMCDSVADHRDDDGRPYCDNPHHNSVTAQKRQDRMS